MSVKPFARTALFALLLGAAALQAQAQTPDRVDRRQAHQDQRIDQGVASGALTRPEAARLTRQQHRIDRMENRAEADGQVSRREAVHLEHAQDRASHRIYRNKHDPQTRLR